MQARQGWWHITKCLTIVTLCLKDVGIGVRECHVTGTCTTRKWHLTLKWCPEAPFFAYKRYEDSLCQGSCALKNETVLCENQGDWLCHF